MRTTADVEQVRPGWVVLTLLIFGGTIAWALRFGLGYLFVPAACEVGDWILHLVTLVAALLAIVALVLSLRWAKRVTDPSVRFSLWFGIALDVFFLGAILLEGSGVLLVDACAKGAIP
ncbi:hypothetical protein [Egicoccus sp. AB-alg6-2]|uniref:hypothetical protein n=1 Tax=Egicoccus sp. AB-alg6-2 TaxID=3242692 RepID=UPI00359E647B